MVTVKSIHIPSFVNYQVQATLLLATVEVLLLGLGLLVVNGFNAETLGIVSIGAARALTIALVAGSLNAFIFAFAYNHLPASVLCRFQATTDDSVEALNEAIAQDVEAKAANEKFSFRLRSTGSGLEWTENGSTDWKPVTPSRSSLEVDDFEMSVKG